MSTKGLLFVLVCLCLHGVGHGADHKPSQREVAQAVADRLRRHVPVPRFQEAQARTGHHMKTHAHASSRSPQEATQELIADVQTLNQEEASLAHAEVEAQTALALVNNLKDITHLDHQPITTDEQRLRVEALGQAHEAILARQRARAAELAQEAAEHEVNIRRLDRQRDAVLRHVRTVADQLAQQQQQDQVGQFSSSASQPDESSSAAADFSSSAAPADESSSAVADVSSSATPADESSSAVADVSSSATPADESSSAVADISSSAASADESSSAAPADISSADVLASSSDSTASVMLPPDASSSDSTALFGGPLDGSSSDSSGGDGGGPMGDGSSSESTAGVVVNDGDNSTTTTAVASSSAKQKFFPGFIDHDPFAKGQTFISDGTAETDINWPSPISDESDDLWSSPSTQPTGGYYTPEVLPPDPATQTATGDSTALYWTPVETTTSSILDNEAVIGWRYKQKMRGTQRSSHSQAAMTPGADDEGNVFSLLQVAEQTQSQSQQSAEDEFSAKHLKQEQTELLAELSEVDKTKPGWL